MSNNLEATKYLSCTLPYATYWISPSSIHQGMVCASDFHISESSIASSFDKLNNIDINKKNFTSFVDRRINYLNRLKLIGDNWISGGAKQPTEKSIELSKKVLSDINFWYQGYGSENYLVPKIIMGPTLAGGLAFEIIYSDTLKALLHIQDSNIILETEEDGYYSEKNIKNNLPSEAIIGLFQSHENKTSNYPGR